MRGSFSGPITMSATTPITISSEKPISNIGPYEQKGARWAPLAWNRTERSGLLLGLALDFAFDRLATDLVRRRHGGLRLFAAAFPHAVLEAAHRAAKVGAHVAQLLRAEDQHHDHQNDQPMPDAERAHIRFSYRCLWSMEPRASGPPRTCI